MAIARGAGTEIIRSIFLEDVNNTNYQVIVGVQHHIYTVLSITMHAKTLNAAGDYCYAYFKGYDTVGATTNQTIYLFVNDMQQGETFVWNDKFSFNGYEPTDFSATLDATKQDAIADQGSSVSQGLWIGAEHASDGFDCTVTYIDQNNA